MKYSSMLEYLITTNEQLQDKMLEMQAQCDELKKNNRTAKQKINALEKQLGEMTELGQKQYELHIQTLRKAKKK